MAEMKCPVCGKTFDGHDEWAYKRGTATLCSWHCLRELEKRGRKHNKAEFTYQGVTKTIKQWAEEKGISYNTLYNRIYSGKINDPFREVK